MCNAVARATTTRFFANTTHVLLGRNNCLTGVDAVGQGVLAAHVVPHTQDNDWHLHAQAHVPLLLHAERGGDGVPAGGVSPLSTREGGIARRHLGQRQGRRLGGRRAQVLLGPQHRCANCDACQPSDARQPPDARPPGPATLCSETRLCCQDPYGKLLNCCAGPTRLLQRHLPAA